jgi:hypothetical protein
MMTTAAAGDRLEDDAATARPVPVLGDADRTAMID